MELMHAAHIPAGAGPFPTILALHGFGSNAHDLLGIAPLVNQTVPGEQVMFLCPQGPIVIEPDRSPFFARKDSSYSFETFHFFADFGNECIVLTI